VTAPRKNRDTKPAKKVARKKPAKKVAKSSTAKPAKKKVKAAKRTTKKKPAAKKPAAKPAPKKKRAARKKAPKRKIKKLVDDAPSKPTGAKKKKDRPKTTSGPFEMWQRIVQVEALISAGRTPNEIIEWCGNGELEGKNWTVEQRQAEEYMRRVRDRWKEEEVELRPDRRREMRSQFKLVYRVAMERNKLHEAVRALDRLCKLDGLYEPERVIFEVEDMADDEARAYIEHAYDTLQLIEEERERIDGERVH
jgi:hypothetical protein